MSECVMMSEYVINKRDGPWVSLHALTTELIKQEDQGMLSESCDESESCPRIPGPSDPALVSPSAGWLARVARPSAGAALCSSFPVTVLPRSGPGRASATDQPAPSPALPSPHSPTSPRSRLTRDTGTQISRTQQKIYKNLYLSFNKFYLGIMDDS